MPIRPPLRAGALPSHRPVPCIGHTAGIRLPGSNVTSSSRWWEVRKVPPEVICEAAEALQCRAAEHTE